MYVNLSQDPDAIDVVRIDEHDTWDMDKRLARIILPMLLQYRQSLDREHHGIPDELHPTQKFYTCDQLQFDFIDEDDDWKAGDKVASDLWVSHVDAMIWSFDRIVRDPNLFGNGPLDHKAYIARVQKGVSLFGEFYMNLWD